MSLSTLWQVAREELQCRPRRSNPDSQKSIVLTPFDPNTPKSFYSCQDACWPGDRESLCPMRCSYASLFPWPPGPNISQVLSKWAEVHLRFEMFWSFIDQKMVQWNMQHFNYLLEKRHPLKLGKTMEKMMKHATLSCSSQWPNQGTERSSQPGKPQYPTKSCDSHFGAIKNNPSRNIETLFLYFFVRNI